MDWSLIIYSALGAAGGGALGTAIAALVQKLHGNYEHSDEPEKADVKIKRRAGGRSVLAAILAVVGYSAVPIYYKNMTLPRILPFELSATKEEAGMYNLIKEHSPEDYKRLINNIDKAARNKNIDQATLNKAREIFLN